MTELIDSTPPWADGVDATPGDPTTGTAEDASLFDGYRDSLDFLIHSPTNPTETPKSIIDEMVTARGTTDNLNERLSVALDVDGTFLTHIPDGDDFMNVAAGVKNWVHNDDFRLWSLGDTSAPDGWALSGSGAAIQRCGTGLADTQRYGIGDFVARITFGSAAAILNQDVIPSGTVATRALQMLRQLICVPATGDLVTRQQYFAVGVAVFATTAAQAYVKLNYGAGSHSSGTHPGDGTWRVLIVGGAVPVATQLSIECHVDITGGAAYFSAPFLIPCTTDELVSNDAGAFDSIRPYRFPPCHVTRREHVIHFAGNQSAGTRKWAWTPRRPGIITDVYLSCGTAPTTQAIIVDLNTWDGAALTSMYSTRPQIAASATEGHAQPDSTYARRCFNPIFTTSKAAGYLVTLDIDQVGTGTVGADMTVTIGYLEYDRPLESFYDYNTE